MKKLFTLVLLFAGTLCASAQVEFVKDGKVIADGETVEFLAESFELAPGMIVVECAPSEPVLRYTGTGSAEVRVTVTKMNPEKDRLTWCGITESCMPIINESEQRSCTMMPGSTKDLALHADFEGGEYTSYTAKVSVRAGISTAKTIYVRFVYADPTGISAAPSAGKISFDGTGLNYAFHTAGAYVLNVYSPSGRLLRSEKLGRNGIYSFSGLQQGVYLYEVRADGRRVAASKVILK